MGLCMSNQQSDGDDSTHFELAGGNVDLVTTKEAWEGKLSQASREGKIKLIGALNKALQVQRALGYVLLRPSFWCIYVIANFSAVWCGPCQMIAPYYSELSEKYPSFMFLTIDVDELTDLSTSFDIKATPTFFFLKDGQQIDKLVGANKPELLKKITTILDSQGGCPQ